MSFLSDLLKYARVIVGRVCDLAITDDEIRSLVLDDVVEHFSRLNPQLGEHTLQLVAGQTLYDFPDTGIMHVTDWSPVDGQTIHTGSNLLGADYSIAELGYYEGLHGGQVAAEVAQKRLERYRIDSVMITGDKVQVLPTPETGRTLYLKTHDMWTLDTAAQFDAVPRKYRQALRHLFAAYLSRAIVEELGRHPSVSIGGSSVAIQVDTLKTMFTREVELAESKSGRGQSIHIG